jgi:hypothetical protein
MNPLNIGPFMLNTELLLFFLSALVGFILFRIRLGQTESDHQTLKETIITAFVLAMFVWKFSVILFDPVTSLRSPLSLLYFNGGDRGVLLAVLAAVIYGWNRLRRSRIPVGVGIELALVAVLGGYGFNHLLLSYLESWQLTFHLASAVIPLILVGWIFKHKHLGTAQVWSQSILWFSIGHVFSSFMETNRIVLWRGFSLQQLVWLAMSLLAAGWAWKTERHQNKEEVKEWDR